MPTMRSGARAVLESNVGAETEALVGVPVARHRLEVGAGQPALGDGGGRSRLAQLVAEHGRVAQLSARLDAEGPLAEWARCRDPRYRGDRGHGVERDP